MNDLILGNTLDVLKKLGSNIIDLGITSPPYNKQEKNKGWLVKNVVYDIHKDKEDEDLYQDNQIEVLNELFRIIKPGGSFFYNHKIRWEKGQMFHPITWLSKTKWNIRQEIIWDRTIAGNIRGWRFWQVEERIYWLYKPINHNLIGKELKSKHALFTSIWKIMPEKSKPHPAPFPIELPTRIIYSILDDEKGIVIDPYCGSGTTLVVAKELGHQYVGIDISKEYLKYAENRLDNYSIEKEKIKKEMDLHVVNKTFTERKLDKKLKSKMQNKEKEEQKNLFLF